MYSLVLLVITTLTVPILYLPASSIWLVQGTLLIVSFSVYIASVGWAINRGTLTAPEDSDSDSSDDDSSDTESSEENQRHHNVVRRGNETENGSGFANASFDPVTSATPLLPHQHRKKHRGLKYHVSFLLLGFLSICLAGYVLAHAATTIVDELHISDMLFGVVILSIATTLPEKFIAVISGHRGHAGILVANTAGSNIFLLTLCLGIVFLDAKETFPRGSVGILEIGMLWGSTAAFTATVWCGARLGRWIGAAMIVAYIAFIALEFVQAHLRDVGPDNHNT